MGISVRDKDGEWTDIGFSFHAGMVTEPLVQERKERYSFPFGDTELVQIIFPGVYIVYGDIFMKRHQLRLRSTDAGNLIELHFSLAGGAGIMHNEVTGRSHTFDRHQHNMIFTPAFDGVGEFQSDQKHRFFEVHFTAQRFLELARNGSDMVRRFADKVAHGQPAELSDTNQYISPDIHRCIHDIMHCQYTGGLKLLFLQSKCVELLVLQAQVFENAAEKASTVLHSQYDRERIAFARDHLLENMLQPPTLPGLAKAAGINEFKLKQGFREIYGTSIHDYLQQHKLTRAKELLQSGLAIKDIADDLGYSSVQHFTNAFRKQYGMPPGRARG